MGSETRGACGGFLRECSEDDICRGGEGKRTGPGGRGVQLQLDLGGSPRLLQGVLKLESLQGCLKWGQEGQVSISPSNHGMCTVQLLFSQAMSTGMGSSGRSYSWKPGPEQGAVASRTERKRCGLPGAADQLAEPGPVPSTR